jgi:hypothetical protein
MANARLIVKSPEMRAFIESVAENWAHDGDKDERCSDNCRACAAHELLLEIDHP